MILDSLQNQFAINEENQEIEPMDQREVKAMEKEIAEAHLDEMSRPRTRGYIIKCDGEHAVVSAMIDQDNNNQGNYWAVGQLVSVKVGLNRVIGLTCAVDIPEESWEQYQQNKVNVTLELVGEIISGKDGEEDKFSSGISNYPKMGCVAHRIRSTDLEVIYKSDGVSVAKVGHLTQDPTVDAKIDIDKLLSRHFAIVGTTGVGKSASVTLILRKIIEARPDVRVLVLDPHNEFASAFPNQSVVLDSTSLKLPFWLFKLDEFAEVIFRGQGGFEAETEILGDLIPAAKERYRAENDSSASSLVKRKTRSNMTADMPVPYRLADLIKLINDRLGKLDGKQEKPILKSLLYRLESVSNDPRFRFMFESGNGGDVLEMVLANLFRVPQNGRPICVLEMSGLPSEVVNSVVSVLCRIAFEMGIASDGGIQTLVVCEEAHRYIPADTQAGFWPTRQSVARIAKEGRKYGAYLGIITQRPGELDSTILSQCNTLFAMRLGNQSDQEIIRRAVANGAKSTISFLSSIANRECIAFGEAIHTPMRMTFETIDAKELPGSRIHEQQEAVKRGMDVSLSAVMRRMRHENGRPGHDQDFDLDKNNDSAPSALGDLNIDPGDEINAILNAAYSGSNGSLNPVPPPPRAQESQSAAQPKRGGMNNLINNFRKR